MAAGSNGQQNFRKAMGALKDSTMVGMAKVNSVYKDLDVAVLKATNHVEALPKEKHVRTILGAVSGSRPRADVVYCIDALARRLGKTRTWAVALKTLIVIHRALREVDPSFCEELISYNSSRGHILNLLHFKDESSPSAWDNSTWIRTYALYLEECLECFRVLKYDFYRDHSRTKKFDIPALLEQLPVLQQLLFRLLACQPGGAALCSFMIQYALSIVAAESVRLYVAITDGVLNLVDKVCISFFFLYFHKGQKYISLQRIGGMYSLQYFEMQRHDAVRALEIYRRAGDQAQRLSNFYEMCRSVDFGRRQKYVKIEQPPPSFLTAMEEYIKDAPQALMLPWKANEDNHIQKVVTEPTSNLDADTEEGSHPSVDSIKDQKTYAEAAPLIPDLLSWDEPCQEASELAEQASPSVSLEGASNLTSSSELSSEPSGWELALVTEPHSDAALAAHTKVNVLDRSTLDSLYEMALAKTSQNESYHVGMVSSNPFESSCYNQETTLYTTSQAPHPSFMQMPQIPQHRVTFIQQQQQQHHDYMHEISQQQTPFQEQPHQQQELSTDGHDFMKIAEIPQEQVDPIKPHQQHEQTSGRDSTNPFTNPFMEQGSLPCPPPSQSCNSSLI
ncbi:putative clathrin assembly protein At5g35200 isoform X1 [Primulina tabacum]|uniref:putative clathrin assembly protein At5g35200 isoform X1 n=1 Tax=Primulina tabacum TaxID=48773 RepID=UPI003F5ABB68